MPWTIEEVAPQANDVCEACRLEPVTRMLTDEIGPRHPYRLCAECCERLERYTLRPMEWFNLAALHSPAQYHLHDDFYDEDGTSMALQYETESYPDGGEQIALLPAPTLNEVREDVELLIDYAFTRWYLTDDVVPAVWSHSPERLLEVVQARVAAAENEAIETTALGLCAAAIGPVAADWVRQCWETASVALWLSPLIEATAACLPRNEALKRSFKALSESLNAKIQWVKYTARGFRNFNNFVNAIYFHCGGLDLAPAPT